MTPESNDYLPWESMMAIAFGALRLSPKAFWKMTPCEWQAGVRGWKESRGIGQETLAVGREELNALMLQFPDAIPE